MKDIWIVSLEGEVTARLCILVVDCLIMEEPRVRV